MQTDTPSERCAFRTPADSHEREVLASYLGEADSKMLVEFAPKDDDELDAELCAGRLRRVVFPNVGALLTMIWKDQARLDCWIEAGVRIELAEPPPGHADSWQPFVLAAYRSLSAWRRAERRRKIIAGIVLSILALAAASILFWLVSPVR